MIYTSQDPEVVEHQRREARAARCAEALAEWRTRVQALKEVIKESEKLGLYEMVERLEGA